jgi:hypothetical protein
MNILLSRYLNMATRAKITTEEWTKPRVVLMN